MAAPAPAAFPGAPLEYPLRAASRSTPSITISRASPARYCSSRSRASTSATTASPASPASGECRRRSGHTNKTSQHGYDPMHFGLLGNPERAASTILLFRSASICCGQPMTTITEVHTYKNGDVETVLTFHCEH
jgi:hypothetical protein